MRQVMDSGQFQGQREVDAGRAIGRDVLTPCRGIPSVSGLEIDMPIYGLIERVVDHPQQLKGATPAGGGQLVRQFGPAMIGINRLEWPITMPAKSCIGFPMRDSDPSGS